MNTPYGTDRPVDLRDLLLLAATDDLAWQDRALCSQTDPEVFYPDKGGSTRAAKQVCLQCDVRAECLEYALDNDERWGLWGGMSERDRRRLKAKRRAATTSATSGAA